MMMDLGYWHPVVIHFVIAWLVAGVVLRDLSFVGRAPFPSQAASLFLVLGGVFALLAWWTGESASLVALRVPWAVAAVESHRSWGEWTVWLFSLVGVLEAVAFFLYKRGKERPVVLASAGLGTLGLVLLITTANKGETVVYSYAGGVGFRSSDAVDRDRLFLAGAFNLLDADRRDGRPGDAARLLEEMFRRYPGDPDVQLLLAESKLLDMKDPAAALETLGRISVPKEDRRLRLRHGVLLVDALLKKGQREAAGAALQSLRTDFPDDPEVLKRAQATGLAP
jgi:uncharacterized membrane protein